MDLLVAHGAARGAKRAEDTGVLVSADGLGGGCRGGEGEEGEEGSDQQTSDGGH